MLAYTVTRNSVTVIVDGVPIVLPRDCGQVPAILEELKKDNPDTEQIKRLADIAMSLELYSDGDISIGKEGYVVYKGEKMPGALARKVTECHKANVPYGNLLKFFERVSANPARHAVEELYDFLEHRGMPVTVNGNFLSYKGVREDYWSKSGGDNSKVVRGKSNDRGQLFNGIGEVIEVKRNYVEDNRDVGCASGLHVGSYEYAQSWGEKVVIVEVDPADVVSVPKDCQFQKLRCCRYTVVAECEGLLTEAGVEDARDPYATPYTAPQYIEEAEDEDDVDADICDDCKHEQLLEDAFAAGSDDGTEHREHGFDEDSPEESRSECEEWLEDDDADDDVVEAYRRGYVRAYYGA